MKSVVFVQGLLIIGTAFGAAPDDSLPILKTKINSTLTVLQPQVAAAYAANPDEPLFSDDLISALLKTKTDCLSYNVQSLSQILEKEVHHSPLQENGFPDEDAFFLYLLKRSFQEDPARGEPVNSYTNNLFSFIFWKIVGDIAHEAFKRAEQHTKKNNTGKD